jgi:uncharacterized protein YabE (DUF348 family)
MNPPARRALLLPAGLWLLGLLAACAGPQATVGTIRVEVSADGSSQTVEIAAGSTVQQALERAQIELGQLTPC